MNGHMTDVAAAGQISQADIIERQAETIALLQHQVQKGTEYKQLTKTKLKEAAARLREYRLRVEALLKETEEARQALKQEKEQHTKTKRTAKLSRKPKGRDVAVQTDVRRTIARQTQTQLSGQMDHVKTRRTVDCGVQTETEVVSRKRGRDQSDGQDGGDQLVPRLSRDSEPGLLTVRSVEKQVSPVVPTEAWKPQVLQMEGQVGFTAMPFTQETSAALDAELASSDSEGDDDQVMVDTVSELILTEKENGGSKVALPLLDPDVSNDIDKDLESSSDEEEDRKEEGASTGIISNGIQQKQAIGASDTGVDGAGDSQNKRVLVSIDDELDDEFATLDSDSEPENQEEKVMNGKKEAEDSSSSSGSSDSDSSDSSSDAGGDDPTTETLQTDLISKGTDATEETKCVSMKDSLVSVNSIIEIDGDTEYPTRIVAGQGTSTTAQPIEEHGGKDTPALPSDEVVVLTTAIEKKPVTAVGNGSPKEGLKSPSQTTLPHQQSLGTAPNVRTEIVEGASTSPQRHGKILTANADRSIDPGDKLSPEKGASACPTLPQMPATDLPDNATSTSIEVEDTQVSGAVHFSSEEKISKTLSLITDKSVVGRPRKASEAISEETEVAMRKKMKLTDDTSQTEDGEELTLVNTVINNNKTTKKIDTSAPDDKDRLQLKKSLAAFKRSTVLGKNEVKGNNYARRTFDSLVKHSSKFIDSHRDHVIKLCQTLADAYRKLEVSPMMVVRSAVGVFRSPRLRRLIPGNESLGVSWLSHQIMVRLVGESDGPYDQNGTILPGLLRLPSLNECLLYLRGLLVEGRPNIGECLPETKMQILVKEQNVHSYDKVFLAQICALHTRLCQSTRQLVCSRVLLYDLLRENPNIRGLYFAMIMLEINPAILEREVDLQCTESKVLLKATLLQGLVVIASDAAAKQDLLLRQSSTSMLHRISDAIQMPELMHIEEDSTNFKTRFLEKLFKELQESCQHIGLGVEVETATSTPKAAPDDFVLAKSLELCTAVFGLDLVAQVFSIDQCQTLFNGADIKGNYRIIAIATHIAMAVAASNVKVEKLNNHSDQYVEGVINWLCQILSVEPMDKTTDDRFDLQQHCAAVCVELILEYTAEEGLSTRRQALSGVISWLDTVPSDRLLDLPAAFLRQLRLAVVAARPHQC